MNTTNNRMKDTMLTKKRVSLTAAQLTYYQQKKGNNPISLVDYVIYNIISNDAELQDAHIVGVQLVPCSFWTLEFTCDKP